VSSAVLELQECLEKYRELEYKFVRKRENTFLNEMGKPKKIVKKGRQSQNRKLKIFTGFKLLHTSYFQI
jgi:phosphopantothenoylcysteine synthetase/decarboxylase